MIKSFVGIFLPPSPPLHEIPDILLGSRPAVPGRLWDEAAAVVLAAGLPQPRPLGLSATLPTNIQRWQYGIIIGALKDAHHQSKAVFHECLEGRGAEQWEPPGDGWPKPGVWHRCSASHPAAALRHCPMLTGWAACRTCLCPCFILQADEPLGRSSPPCILLPASSLGRKLSRQLRSGGQRRSEMSAAQERIFLGQCWRSRSAGAASFTTLCPNTPARPVRILLGVGPVGTLWSGPALSLHSGSPSVPAASFIFLGSPCPAPSNLVSLEIPRPLLSAGSFST